MTVSCFPSCSITSPLTPTFGTFALWKEGHTLWRRKADAQLDWRSKLRAEERGTDLNTYSNASFTVILAAEFHLAALPLQLIVLKETAQSQQKMYHQSSCPSCGSVTFRGSAIVFYYATWYEIAFPVLTVRISTHSCINSHVEVQWKSSSLT